jgi:CHASE3 domain sensor protein
MSIPLAIEKDIDQVKVPERRIMYKLLIGAVIVLGGVVAWLAKGGNKTTDAQIAVYKAQLSACEVIADKKDIEIARLNSYIIHDKDEQLERDRKSQERLNDIINKYQTLSK